MKYMIAYLLKGDAETYQRGLMGQISKELGKRNLNNHIPPHLTLKTPFETSDIQSIERVISDVCKRIELEDIQIDGFGDFDERVVFLDVKFSMAARKNFRILLEDLVKEAHIKLSGFDGPNYHFHVTLSYVKNDRELGRLKKLLLGRSPKYSMKFDNIAILRKPKNDWEIYKEFEIK